MEPALTVTELIMLQEMRDECLGLEAEPRCTLRVDQGFAQRANRVCAGHAPPRARRCAVHGERQRLVCGRRRLAHHRRLPYNAPGLRQPGGRAAARGNARLWPAMVDRHRKLRRRQLRRLRAAAPGGPPDRGGEARDAVGAARARSRLDELDGRCQPAQPLFGLVNRWERSLHRELDAEHR